mgnify:FL=1
MSSKITCTVLRDIIKNHFANQGKRLTNISKANKSKLLNIIEKYNIDTEKYFEEQKKIKEERIIQEKEQRKQERKKAREQKIFNNKCILISNLLNKKWYNEFHKHPHKKVIKKIYELEYNKKVAEYEYKIMNNKYDHLLKIMEDVGAGVKEFDLLGDDIFINGNFGKIIVGSIIIDKPEKKFCWLDRKFMKKFIK